MRRGREEPEVEPGAREVRGPPFLGRVNANLSFTDFANEGMPIEPTLLRRPGIRLPPFPEFRSGAMAFVR